MKLYPLAAVLLLVAATARAAPNPLAAERGGTRPVVLVAPDPGDPAATALAQALANPATRAAFADRQVVVFTVLAGHGEREGRALEPAATAALLAALGLRANGPATTLLVGKDGGVKLRRSHFSAAEIIGAIDRMPMRRQEVGGG